jgi:hypothetical protein
MVVFVRVQTPHNIILLIIKIQPDECLLPSCLRVINLFSFVMLLFAEKFKNLGVDRDLRKADKDTSGDLAVMHLNVPGVLSNVCDRIPLFRISVQDHP